MPTTTPRARVSIDAVVAKTRARASTSSASAASSRGVARRRARARASTTDENDENDDRRAVDDRAARAAWRGGVPTQSSLPLNPDGSVNYASIDANPISKVLTRTIRGLLVGTLS